MLHNPRSTGLYIFCAFKATARFSTSRSVAKETTRRIRSRYDDRPERQHSRFDSTSANSTGSSGNYGRPRGAPPSTGSKSTESGNNGSYHKSFRPGKGEIFDRAAPIERKQDRQDTETQKLTVRLRVAAFEERLYDDAAIQKLDLDHDSLGVQFAKFKDHLFEDLEKGSSKDTRGSLLDRLMNIVAKEDNASLDLQLKYAFYGFVSSSRFSSHELRDQERLLDFKHPAEWFPRARQVQRQIHVHVGPTNSGKTYRALKRLEEAKTGCYAGPLRLLAHEIFERLNANGNVCNLVTGDDRRDVEIEDHGRKKLSCTVEMVPLRDEFDVLVIDEIQMLGSEDRGWAWTQAFLGAIAKEVHVCGEERTVPIIQALAAECGDVVHIHTYERLSPLEMMPKSLGGNLRNLKKGDCIVGFSIMVLHSLKTLVEQTTHKKCAIIYGTLPPETRAQQAKLFNDPDNDYDYLVASNAVGMGLNLSIRRLIFQSAYRSIQGRFEPLTPPEIKQIAGRAGRYSTAAADVKNAKAAAASGDAVVDVAPTSSRKRLPGLVTTLEELDYPVVEGAMDYEPEPIPTAGIFPPTTIIEHFARYFPAGTPFSYLLLQLRDHAQLSLRLHLCDFNGHIAVADALECVPGLRLVDLYNFCLAPFDMRKKGEPELAQAYARLVAGARGATVLEVDELDLNVLEDDQAADREYLRKLERLHKGLVSFMWLSYKFSQIFLDRELTIHVKELVEERIEKTLGSLAFDYNKMRKSRDQAILDLLGSKSVQHPEQQEVDGEAISVTSSSHDAVDVVSDVVDDDSATPKMTDFRPATSHKASKSFKRLDLEEHSIWDGTGYQDRRAQAAA